MRREIPPHVEADVSGDWTLDSDDLLDLLDDLEDEDPDLDRVNLTIEFQDPGPLNLGSTPTLNKKSGTHFDTVKVEKGTLERLIGRTDGLDGLLMELLDLEDPDQLTEAGLLRVILSKGK